MQNRVRGGARSKGVMPEAECLLLAGGFTITCCRCCSAAAADQFYAYNGAHSLFGMPCLQVGDHVGGACGECVQAPRVA